MSIGCNKGSLQTVSYQYQCYIHNHGYFYVTVWYSIIWWCLFTNNNHYLASTASILDELSTRETFIHISLHINHTTDILNNRDRTWIPFTEFFQFHFQESFLALFNYLYQHSHLILFHFLSTTTSTPLLQPTVNIKDNTGWLFLYSYTLLKGLCDILLFLLNKVIIVACFIHDQHHFFVNAIFTGECAISII